MSCLAGSLGLYEVLAMEYEYHRPRLSQSTTVQSLSLGLASWQTEMHQRGARPEATNRPSRGRQRHVSPRATKGMAWGDQQRLGKQGFYF